MKGILYILFSLFCWLNAFSQADSSKVSSDSARHSRYNTLLMQLQRLSAERSADSLKKNELEKEVSALSSADNLRRVDLMKELRVLKARDSLKVLKQKRQVDSLRKFVKGFPVAPFRDTLFMVFTRQGSFTAQERAAAVTQRINKLGNDLGFQKDSLKVTDAELTTDITYRDRLIISVSDQDALWVNSTKRVLASQMASRITSSITRFQQENRWQTLLKEGLFALLVIFIAVLLIIGINYTFRRLTSAISKQRENWFKGIRIRQYEVLNKQQQLSLVRNILKIVKSLLVILIVFLALPVLFGIFPFTRDLSSILLTYITSPLKTIAISIWHYIPNLITIIILVFVFRLVLGVFRYLKTEVEKGALVIPGFYADWAAPTYQIVRILTLAFMLIVIFPYLPGSDSAVFKGVSVFMGVLFTFGSAGALGNVVAGLVMTYMRAFKIGDRVKIGEVTGDIIEKTLLVTRVRTIQNEIVSIPNSTVMSSHTTNYSSEASSVGLIVNTTVTIGYDAPWRKVHQLLINAALATPLIESEPAPYVLQTSLDDFYVCYRINAYTKAPNQQAIIYSALHANIQDEFNKGGVEIMSPHYKSLRDGNATTIPAEDRPATYQAPAFDVNVHNQESRY